MVTVVAVVPVVPVVKPVVVETVGAGAGCLDALCGFSHSQNE